MRFKKVIALDFTNLVIGNQVFEVRIKLSEEVMSYKWTVYSFRFVGGPSSDS